MAEAVARQTAGAEFIAYSAGTHPAAEVNATALHLLQARGIEILGLHPKTLEEIPDVDYVVTMGCGVECPVLACVHREDWGLDDPSGGSLADYEDCLAAIEQNMLRLRQNIAAKGKV